MTTTAPQVLTCWAPPSSGGRSVFALNLAAYLGLRGRVDGRSVCFVDADVRHADAGKYLSQYSPSIAGLAEQSDAAVADFLIHRSDLNLSALLAPACYDDVNPLRVNALLYRQVLPELRGLFDTIVVNAPSRQDGHDLLHGFALPVADALVVVAEPTATSIQRTGDLLATQPHPTRTVVAISPADDPEAGSEDCAALSPYPVVAFGTPRSWRSASNTARLAVTLDLAEINAGFSAVAAAVGCL